MNQHIIESLSKRLGAKASRIRIRDGNRCTSITLSRVARAALT